jgi:N-acetylglutamate synthase-like GNAT family acetyltransferase
MTIAIDYLANHPQWLPILAEWTYSEWGKFDSNNSLQATIKRYEDRLNKDHIPLMLVAYSDSHPVGCVSLKETGMTIRPDYTPWLGSMYVNPKERRKGIGSQLMQRAIAESKKLLVPTLYLWTALAEGFYLKYGFNTIESTRYLDQDTKIMALHISRE